MGKSKTKRKQDQELKRSKKRRAGKLVRFNLANSPVKYPGEKNKFYYQSNMCNLIFKGRSFKNVRNMNCTITSCNFKNSNLLGVDFMHTNLKNTKFNNSVIKNCVFFNCRLKNTDFSGAKFENVFFICTAINEAKGLIEEDGWTVERSYPSLELNSYLQNTIVSLARIRPIYKARVLHVDATKPNLWIVKILLKRYNPDILSQALKAINNIKDKQRFYTLYSYMNFVDNYKKR